LVSGEVTHSERIEMQNSKLETSGLQVHGNKRWTLFGQRQVHLQDINSEHSPGQNLEFSFSITTV
jgi:hypothetical protein